MTDRRPPRKVEGLRLRLEAREPLQAGGLFELIEKNRLHLKPWMLWEERTNSIADSAAFITGMMEGWQHGDEFDYAVFEKASDVMIGSFGLHTIDWFNRCCHVGFWIDQDLEGRGFVSEALRLGEDLARDLGFHRLVITCNRHNQRSRAVALRNGYRQEAIMIDAAFEKGQWRDTCLFAKLLNEAGDGLPVGCSFREAWTDQNYELAIFDGAELAARISGFPTSDAEKSSDFRIAESVVAPEHRGRGLYGILLDEMLRRLQTKGLQRICSRQPQSKNGILMAKLRKGFQMTSLEQGAEGETLVNLVYRF